MNAYGSTLDSLSANALAQDQVAQQGRNAYRQYLLGIGQLGQRGREIDSMDRYRQGEIGVRQEDVGGMNEFRRGQVDIGRRDATTRQFDAESLDQYRRGEIGVRGRGLDVNRELGLKSIDAQNAARWDAFIDPIKGAQARLLEAQADAIKRSGGFSLLPRDTQNLAAADRAAREDAAGMVPFMDSLLAEELGKIRRGEWKWNDWGNSDDVEQLRTAAKQLVGEANPADENKPYTEDSAYSALVRQRAAQRAIMRSRELGIEPNLLKFDAATGKISVGPSPYMSLLNGGGADTTPKQPSNATSRYLPAPGQSLNPNPAPGFTNAPPAGRYLPVPGQSLNPNPIFLATNTAPQLPQPPQARTNRPAPLNSFLIP